MFAKVRKALKPLWVYLKLAAVVSLVPTGMRWLFAHDPLLITLGSYLVTLALCLLVLACAALLYQLVFWLKALRRR